MNKKLAKTIINQSVKTNKELNDLLFTIKEHSSDTEFELYKSEIAKIMADLLLNIVNPIIKQYPELKPKEMEDSGYFKKKWLIELLKEQEPRQKKIIEQLDKMKAEKWLKQPYIRFVDGINTNQKGAEWQFEKSIRLEHKTEGTIILDILKDGRIGGFELLDELD